MREAEAVRTTYHAQRLQYHRGILSPSTAIAIIIVLGISSTPPTNNETTKNWISSGPFSIDKQQYLLGENIFLIASSLQTHEKGEIQFIRPSGDIYRTIPFDGQMRSDFNQYFTPFPSSALKVCSSDKLVGKWFVKFEGTNYESIEFEIVNEYLKGEEYKLINDC